MATLDRATLLNTIDKLYEKKFYVITHKIIDTLKKNITIKSMTFDNNQAFSQHEKIAKALKIKTYFTRPFTSHYKRTIENRNGFLRFFFPKNRL